jgi:hypothetical protein
LLGHALIKEYNVLRSMGKLTGSEKGIIAFIAIFGTLAGGLFVAKRAGALGNSAPRPQGS